MGRAEGRSRDRRNVEQGPACGMRPWSRSWARRIYADPARLRGQIPRGAPLPPVDAPQFPWGCDQAGRVGALSRGPNFIGGATAETSKAADGTDVETCRNRFGGCAQAADAMWVDTCRL